MSPTTFIRQTKHFEILIINDITIYLRDKSFVKDNNNGFTNSATTSNVNVIEAFGNDTNDYCKSNMYDLGTNNPWFNNYNECRGVATFFSYVFLVHKKNYLLNSIRNIELIISKDNFHFDMMSSIEVDVEFVYWRDDV